MSTFGSPGGQMRNSKPSPPERGSFPLDHDGECKIYMADYLKCLKQNRGVNQDECRMMSKAYLKCRMDRGLMAPDEMKNLGYADSETEADVTLVMAKKQEKAQKALAAQIKESKGY